MTEMPIDDVDITSTPAGATGWTIVVANNSDERLSIVWDESSFVTAASDVMGRLIRGETRKIDSAKSQPPTPVPSHTRAREFVLAEKFIQSEDAEGEYADALTKYGYVTPQMTDVVVTDRASRAGLIRGGRINLVVTVRGETRTWVGLVSK